MGVVMSHTLTLPYASIIRRSAAKQQQKTDATHCVFTKRDISGFAALLVIKVLS